MWRGGGGGEEKKKGGSMISAGQDTISSVNLCILVGDRLALQANTAN